MKRVFLTTMLVFLGYGASYAGNYYSFIIHLNGEEITYKKEIPEFDEIFPKTLNVYPKKVISVRMRDGHLLVVSSDPSKSDAFGAFYIYKGKVKQNPFEYIYSTGADSLQEIYVLTKNIYQSIYVISVWGDEDSFIIRVDSIDNENNMPLSRNIFYSNRRMNPWLNEDLSKVCIQNGDVYVLYSYHDRYKLKEAKLTKNPSDTTGELYIKPISLITVDQWKNCLKNP